MPGHADDALAVMRGIVCVLLLWDGRHGRSVAWWFRIPFWQRVMGAFVLGALVGWLVGEPAARWFQPWARSISR